MRLQWFGLLLLSAATFSQGYTEKYLERIDYSGLHDAEGHSHDATDSFLFSSIASLLQQWPNTRWRNGHTIVRGKIPVGTILYHERGDKYLPLVPEWAAFNVEHSYLVCGAAPPPECWMLTLAVEEPLEVIYFDGSSGANSYLGHLDTQDLLIWGEVRRDKMMAEWERIEELCKWGKRYSIDAFVREVMLCDFTKKVKVTSSIRLIPTARHTSLSHTAHPNALWERQRHRLHGMRDLKRDRIEPRPVPPNWQGPLRDGHSISLETVLAAAWNNLYPGEVRMEIDYSRLISFYDPKYTSLVEARGTLSRIRHRVANISREDWHTAMADLDADLTRVDDKVSGVDWAAVTRAVTDRYADRLYLLNQTLTRSANAKTVAAAARRHLMVMLTPYLVYEALPDASSNYYGKHNISWIEPIKFYCATSITSAIKVEALTRSERLIKSAVDGVLQRICSSLTQMWVGAFGVSNASEEEAAGLVLEWTQNLQKLIQWLDWSVWNTCRPACSEEMFCYISTWPWGFPWTEEDVDTIDMTPRCIDRETGELGPNWGVLV
ncbi:hypothetical protein M408DRAFT_329490 [Serendipita vermifera MAFF 305830]|uniref:Uncharacterized protein n=1 Tax=Serendipita vermifera MAFF 305830 TaxID=933852 RepID=A0A0C2XH44_SERVB|nr:hypothetical protein M408DRAFT_329490 [Serendipita vermifera MAFF 305830]